MSELYCEKCSSAAGELESLCIGWLGKGLCNNCHTPIDSEHDKYAFHREGSLLKIREAIRAKRDLKAQHSIVLSRSQWLQVRDLCTAYQLFTDEDMERAMTEDGFLCISWLPEVGRVNLLVDRLASTPASSPPATPRG